MACLNYDELATEYARNRRLHPGVLRALASGGEIDRESTVLEIGCGTGNYAIALREMTGCAIVGVDPSSGMLEKARARSEDVDWRAGSAAATGQPDGRFDLVFMVDVIHHVPNRATFSAEAMRVLAPGGRLCIATDSAEDIERRRPLSSHFPETVPFELARYPSISTLTNELTAAGFQTRIDHVELEYPLTDATAYRDRAFSSLHLIPAEAFTAGLARLESDLATGPVAALSLYTLVWAVKPDPDSPGA